MKFAISGGTIVAKDGVLKGKSLIIEDGLIVELSDEIPSSVDRVMELSEKSILYPGLINAHDHLLGNYYPRVGGGTYMSWLPWDNDLKSAPVYAERGKISNKDLYLLAAYRNLISGVTVVSDHMPHAVSDALSEGLPLKVIHDFCMSHEMSSYDLKWGDAPTVEHRRAAENDWPYITHIEEGFDEEAMLGTEILSELGILDEYTVLIHGVALSDKDIEKIANAGAHLVHCPNSNHFMFGETVNMKKVRESGMNVTLGTDSPMSGGLNLFDEMQAARASYKDEFGEILSGKEIYDMVTVNAATALRQKGFGAIEKGAVASLTVLNGNPDDPFESLVNGDLKSVDRVFIEGKLSYGLPEDEPFFKNQKTDFERVSISGAARLLIGEPIELYERIVENVGFEKELPFFPIEVMK